MKYFNTDNFSFIIHFGSDIRAELHASSLTPFRNFQMQDIIIFKVDHFICLHKQTFHRILVAAFSATIFSIT